MIDQFKCCIAIKCGDCVFSLGACFKPTSRKVITKIAE